jgi:hypothetical protein
MAALPHFIGTWKNAPHDPRSAHTLTWRLESTGLRGRWIVEPTMEGDALVGGTPRAYEMRVGRCWIEDDVLLFHVNGSAWPSEFRLTESGEAVLGVASEKLGREIDGHRLRLLRSLGD